MSEQQPMTDEQFQAEVKRREDAAKTTQAEADKAKAKGKPDQYYPVKTGDTFDSIAKELNREGKGQELMDCAHSGGISNGENAAIHDNLIRGANGDAQDERGRLVPVIGKDHITTKTKLIEGLSLLLPEGW